MLDLARSEIARSQKHACACVMMMKRVKHTYDAHVCASLGAK
jgi:hypothetical protein